MALFLVEALFLKATLILERVQWKAAEQLVGESTTSIRAVSTHFLELKTGGDYLVPATT